MILRGCAGWSGPLLLQITKDRFFSRGPIAICHLTMRHIRKQDAKVDNLKYDNSDRIVICAFSSKHFQ